MDLMCLSRDAINWILTVHYLAYGLAGLIFWQVPSQFSTRGTFLVFGTLHITAQWLMLLVPNYWARMFAFALQGFCQLKQTVCLTWALGLVQSKYKPIVCSAINAVDMLTLCVICGWFEYVSKEWFGVMLGATVVATLSYVLIVAFLPETPQKCIELNQSALPSLEYISKFNQVDPCTPEEESFSILEDYCPESFVSVKEPSKWLRVKTLALL